MRFEQTFIARSLLAEGAGPRHWNVVNWMTVLHYAASCRNVRVVRMLLAARANDFVSRDGNRCRVLNYAKKWTRRRVSQPIRDAMAGRFDKSGESSLADTITERAIPDIKPSSQGLLQVNARAEGGIPEEPDGSCAELVRGVKGNRSRAKRSRPRERKEIDREQKGVGEQKEVGPGGRESRRAKGSRSKEQRKPSGERQEVGPECKKKTERERKEVGRGSKEEVGEERKEVGPGSKRKSAQRAKRKPSGERKEVGPGQQKDVGEGAKGSRPREQKGSRPGSKKKSARGAKLLSGPTSFALRGSVSDAQALPELFLAGSSLSAGARGHPLHFSSDPGTDNLALFLKSTEKR
ncbi:MAG: hypothetical protein M1839_002098 [Geoglossum umbratile]|nr:MAG: hypothetical protein M1839_002098 [Geoglossum umbratile]